MEQQDQLKLERVVFYGRSLAEYELFFGFKISELKGLKVLDCPAGTASFAAEATRAGVQVIAVDPVFENPPDKMRAIAKADIDHVMDEVNKVRHIYTWTYFKNFDEMRAARYRGLDEFATDFAAGKPEGRYLATALPTLPFNDRQFDLVLSGHLLFIYSDHLDYEFHLASLRELSRVSADEVRIFPASGMNRKPAEHLDRLRSELHKQGIESELRPSRYEFVVGWNQMLVLRRAR